MELNGLLGGLIVLVGFFSWYALKSDTVYAFQKAIKYKNGKIVGILEPGRYFRVGNNIRIDCFDMRRQQFLLSGQELLTKDNVNIRMSLIGSYQFKDLVKLTTITDSHMQELQSYAQLAIRRLVGEVTLEELLAQKTQFDKTVHAEVASRALEIGIEVSALAVRDIMLPTNLKKLFAGSLEARKESERQLEVARGEQAVLRSLANSSKLYHNNPSLLQARVIQALANGNNSIVFGADDKMSTRKNKP